MSVYAVVAEYNPFHNGHLHQIKEIKKNVDDYVVVIMSPNVVQRGDFAVFDKWTRCQAAINCGADLVLELPSAYAMRTAEKFAFGAIYILNALNCVDYLSFGSESANLPALISAVEILKQEKTDKRIKELLKDGITYAKARSLAVEEQDKNAAEILCNANDILGVEYIKQLDSLKSKITPKPLLRVGSAHDDERVCGEYASASYLRGHLDWRNLINYVPNDAYDVFLQAIDEGAVSGGVNTLSETLILKLLELSPEAIKNLPDVSEGLENRIIRAAKEAENLNELCELIKTKRYTMARIRRILMYALLSFPKAEDIPNPQYIRILGANENGKKLISRASLPVLTSLSRAEAISEEAKLLCKLEERCTDAFGLTLLKRKANKNEYSTKPIGF